MFLIDRHIFSEWFKTFVVTALVILSLLILEDMQDDLQDMIGWGATTAEIGKYYLYLLPTFLPLVVPVSLFVSLLFSLSNLHKNYEIIAMRASGLGLFRITRSIWLTAVALMALLMFLNAKWTPYYTEQTRTIRDNLRFNKQMTYLEKEDVGLIHKVTFDNHKERRLWVMNRFSEYTYQGFGVTIYELDKNRQETRRLMAREGYFNNVYKYWILLDGLEMKFDEQGDPIFSKAFDKRGFPEFDEAPNLMKTLSKMPEELSYEEIGELLERIPPEENPNLWPFAVRYQAILASPFSCLIIVGIAVPFAISGVRTNPLVGVSKASIFILLYFAVFRLGGVLGNLQILSPIVAAWLPNIAMLGVSFFLFRKIS